jgi:hypothetical protein
MKERQSAKIAAEVSPRVKRRLRVEAAKRDTAMADLIREATRDWLTENADTQGE